VPFTSKPAAAWRKPEEKSEFGSQPLSMDPKDLFLHQGNEGNEEDTFEVSLFG
jgi:hypothetical protein